MIGATQENNKHLKKSIVIVALFSVAPLGYASAIEEPRVAKDLASSSNLIRNKVNKKYYDYDMGNINVDPSDENLGKFDNSNPISKNIIGKLGIKNLSVEETKELKVGIKQLPYQTESYIAWAYIGEVIYPMFDEKDVLIPEDKRKESLPPRLSLGFFKRDSAKLEELILLYEPISNLQLRRQETPASFDFAPYNLGSLGRAFGLRTNVGGCGAGGSLCSNQYLKLFVIKGNQLTQVFNEAISYFGNIAGSWHKDGTRDHEIIENNGLIKVAESDDNTVPNLMLEFKENGKIKRRRFSYKETNNLPSTYKSSDKQIIDLVDE